MNILAIDTSTIVASVAIINEDKLLGEMMINHQKKHSEKLMTAIDHLLSDSGLDLSNIDVFGVVEGPGSFTGLRIGMATAKGFAQGLNKPLIGVSTLASLANNVPTSSGYICPILDAQRNQVYTGIYYFDASKLKNKLTDTALEIEDLIEEISKLDGNIYCLGDGIPRFYEQIEKSCSNTIKVPNHVNMNRASSAAELVLHKALTGDFMDYKQLEPVYLRPSYAEEKKC
ncbi:MAG: tRNA threonylcarbamoyladenosine biosynthesis protein TsaB [Eubacteriaceae bacterium]|jgi:tRNA threonylcarbamoyladenosine biosynthesis protein TsaB|nr:tRNA threonylcarbamoyladenosine biosynthesis protein TsaB [Eubacteriaceae bacterium]MDN5307036.1 tRNA threonylcarbamoyladenosine biosynthesis protein TsaB [Eubacteriaceae bacterium]